MLLNTRVLLVMVALHSEECREKETERFWEH